MTNLASKTPPKSLLQTMRCAAAVILLLIASCTRHEPEALQVEGLSKQAVIERLGDPKSIDEIDGKRLKASTGPTPQLADRMGDGEFVEVWVYLVKDDRAASLYFDENGVVEEVVLFRTDLTY